MRSQSITTADLDEHIRCTPGWAQHYRQMSPGVFQGHLRMLEMAGQVQVFEERLNTRVEQHFVAPQGALVCSFDTAQNALYLLDERCENCWVTPPAYRELAVVFHGPFLACHGVDPASVGRWRLAPLVSVQARVFSGWLGKTLRSDGSPLNEATLARQLWEDCLFVLECSQPPGMPRSALQPRQHDRQLFNRVMDAVASDPRGEFTAPRLAQLAGVSLGRLQQGFRAFTGLSPTQWLRLRRLNMVRRDLLQAPRASTTVAEVAMRWAFWHLGRFAGSYRLLFGEWPSQTLAR
ncbi:helix-turn-helix domain-containing protein [Pseudomonas typographi]|uniref:helix-turn-helix domain-containing protein n=1 Tax=Pseudomonas typographi TaxID=2715964 RepID=UPI001684515B|nr:helix-turn-helix domain-containing protein [Pseudomonas typographi]MBD1589907.1 helix-turn-helix domain-containing protein [Pseudomonas typographi]